MQELIKVYSYPRIDYQQRQNGNMLHWLWLEIGHTMLTEAKKNILGVVNILGLVIEELRVINLQISN